MSAGDFTGSLQIQENAGQARIFNPYLNRWSQPDTIVPNLYNPQSLNRYSYVKNNPVNFVDPSGHVPICLDEWCRDTSSTCDDPANSHLPGCKGAGGDIDGGDEPSFCEQNLWHERCYGDELDKLINDRIDILFNPFYGWVGGGAGYYGSMVDNQDLAYLFAYELLGIDYLSAAALGQSNPLDINQIGDIDGYISVNGDGIALEHLYYRMHHPQYGLFLDQMGIPSSRSEQNITNYEANYLSALMSNNPRALQQAKTDFRSFLDRRFNNDKYGILTYLGKTMQFVEGSDK